MEQATLSRLPVIVAQGGISPAGRTSGFRGYQRLVIDCLASSVQAQALAALASIRQLPHGTPAQQILAGSLVRPLAGNQSRYCHQPITLPAGTEFTLTAAQLPQPLPASWQTEALANGAIKVRLTDPQSLMLPVTKPAPVSAAGQLPSGFKPEQLYQSRHHPRALAMTVFAAHDALASSGLNGPTLKGLLAPEQMAVYAGSAMSQLDHNGNGGMLQAALLGKRVTAKQCPLGFAEMAGDFVNAYILGSLGATGTRMGACATLLYNLQAAVAAIRSGKHKLVIVGSSEAPITPEIIDGYVAMGALASDEALRALDQLSPDQPPDWRRACRPFGHNCGFTLAESAQYFILMDDELALACGADVLGAVGDVFIHADGFKKSISAPGAGNYLTMARAAALGRAVAGAAALQHGSFVQAHGTGTPQNRVTESHVLDKTAQVFGITHWPVTAVKSYVGHSLGAAAGDQIMSTLGAWQHGWLPGINTIDCLADDVSATALNILTAHHQLDAQTTPLALVNAKGFGGNNATALLLSPALTTTMLQAKHGRSALTAWQQRREHVTDHQARYEQRCQQGDITPVYQFGTDVLSGTDLTWDDQHLQVPGYGEPVKLAVENPFWSF